MKHKLIILFESYVDVRMMYKVDCRLEASRGQTNMGTSPPSAKVSHLNFLHLYGLWRLAAPSELQHVAPN